MLAFACGFWYLVLLPLLQGRAGQGVGNIPKASIASGMVLNVGLEFVAAVPLGSWGGGAMIGRIGK